jgi:hypothetical protein
MINSFDGNTRDHHHHHHQSSNAGGSPTKKMSKTNLESHDHYHQPNKEEMMKDLRADIGKLYSLVKPQVTFSPSKNPTPSVSSLSNVSHSQKTPVKANPSQDALNQEAAMQLLMMKDPIAQLREIENMILFMFEARDYIEEKSQTNREVNIRYKDAEKYVER